MSDLSRLSDFQGVLDLAEWSVLVAKGSDALSFLHGQLTQDIAGLGDAQARLAGYCSPKGRLLASFVVWRMGDDEVALACSADLAPGIAKRLSMFVLRSDCRVTDAGQRIRLRGAVGSQALAHLGESAPRQPWDIVRRGDGQVIRLPDVQGVPRLLVVGEPELSMSGVRPLQAEAWSWLEVCSGIPRICAATSDQFVPQMINWEVVGGVHFQKGCYPGQEVVARSQYRGTIKRRGQLFDVESAAKPGDLIFSCSDPEQPAGMVVLAASDPLDPARFTLFAEVKSAVLADDVRLHTALGPRLAFRALPYPVPAEP